MGLHEVESAIKRNIEAAAERKLEIARAQAARIVAAGTAQMTAERAHFDEQTRELLAALERRETGQASAHGKTVILEAQRAAITDTFAHSNELLNNLNPKARAALLTELIARAQRELPGIARIRVNQRDVDTARTSAPSGVTIIADASITAGLIAEDNAGDVRSELTYDTMLSAVRERELPVVAHMLFPDRNKRGVNDD